MTHDMHVSFSVQHLYQWEAPDGNQFLMDPLASATSGGSLGAAGYPGVGGGVGAPGLDPGAPPWQPVHSSRLGVGDQLYALGGYDGGGQLSTVCLIIDCNRRPRPRIAVSLVTESLWHPNSSGSRF